MNFEETETCSSFEEYTILTGKLILNSTLPDSEGWLRVRNSEETLERGTGNKLVLLLFLTIYA